MVTFFHDPFVQLTQILSLACTFFKLVESLFFHINSYETKDILTAARNTRIVNDRHETDFVPMVFFSRGRRHSVLSILVFWVSINPTPFSFSIPSWHRLGHVTWHPTLNCLGHRCPKLIDTLKYYD